MKLPIASAEATILDVPEPPVAGRCRSLYVHVPFCFHKCHYCDFYSLVDDESRHEPFVRTLLAELESASEFLAPELETIFVGGGTPTLLSPALWSEVLERLRPRCGDSTEFTVEANPETVTPELAATLNGGGVNRISIGCQSFHPAHLKTLERWHEPANVGRSMEIFRRAGIENLNLDLIFGIPGQTLADWIEDLDRAMELEPDHLSCYGLTYETNTPLYVKMKSGGITPIDSDVEADMYEATMERLAAAGYEQYELSNWARPGRRCRHNMVYWTNGDWWALGPSASGHVCGLRWKNASRVSEYIDERERAGWLPPIAEWERVDESTRVGEEFMLGLRLNQGLPASRLETLLRLDGGVRRRAEINRLMALGFLEQTPDALRLTRAGRLQANVVVEALL